MRQIQVDLFFESTVPEGLLSHAFPEQRESNDDSESQTETSVQPQIEVAPVNEERVVDLSNDIDDEVEVQRLAEASQVIDEDDSDEFDSFNESNSEEALEKMAAKLARKGVSAGKENFLTFDEFDEFGEW